MKGLRKANGTNSKEAGCDEAGRGCLAGPVVAAAVIPGKSLDVRSLDDSKKLTPADRSQLFEQITKHALAWSIASASPKEIDEHNILNASIMAMHRALEGLPTEPAYLLIDGNRFKPFRDIPYQCVVGGDGTYIAIAAASVLAKHYRDRVMKELHEQVPLYRWDSNKGYPTPDHREGIETHGISVHHRRSFHLLPKQLNFGL